MFPRKFPEFLFPPRPRAVVGEAPGLSLPLVPPPPQTTPLSRLLGGVLKTGEGVRVGVGEELGVARHGVARPHGRRAAEDGAPGYRLPVLGENLLYLGVVPLPSEAHSPQTLDSTRARELLRKKTLPVGHDPPTRQQRPLDLDPPHPNRPSPSSRAAPLSLTVPSHHLFEGASSREASSPVHMNISTLSIRQADFFFFFFWGGGGKIFQFQKKNKFGHRIVHLDSRDERESLEYPKEVTRAKTRLQNPRVEG